MMTFMLGLAVFGCLAWLALYLAGAMALLRIPKLADAVDMKPEMLPTLSIVIPACNEADTIESALTSLLVQDYPGLEIILVNDRSSDGTGAIMAQMANRDPRLHVVTITSLPAGWLGKVHALQQAYTQSKGDFVLFSDADVHFNAGVLCSALIFAQQQQLDHLSLLPKLQVTTTAQRALMQSFFTGYIRRFAACRDPVNSSVYFGFGAFNLIRRTAFDNTGGFEWLRMEVVDDIGLGALMKSRGRSGFAVAHRQLSLLWYPDLKSTLIGFEKNLFGAICGYRYWVVLPGVLLLILLGLAPLMLLLLAYAPWHTLLALAALGSLLAESLVARLRFSLSLGGGILSPLAHLLMAWAMLRSSFMVWRRSGIVWRGTFYPIASLRAGRRVSFP